MLICFLSQLTSTKPLVATLVQTLVIIKTQDAAVEITAKVFEGYEGGDVYKVDDSMMTKVMGRDYDYKKSDAELAATESRAALQGSGAAAKK